MRPVKKQFLAGFSCAYGCGVPQRPAVVSERTPPDGSEPDNIKERKLIKEFNNISENACESESLAYLCTFLFIRYCNQ